MTRTTRRMVGVGITLVATVGLAVGASGVTSAYFSDTNQGTVTGSIGWVRVQTDGGTGGDFLDLSFDNLFPGEPQTVKFNYRNTGSGVQDLWLTFPNRQALHALNNLGHFGYLKITDTSAGTIFESTNLQDGRTLPDTTKNSCGNPPVFTAADDGCNPLMPTLKVRNNLAVGASGTVSITFAYASGLGTGQNGGPADWNSYPSDNPPYSQAYGDDATGPAGAGLPYNVVATQVGQQP